MSESPTVTSMLEDLETHAEHPAAVLAIVSDLRTLLGLPDERREQTSDGAANTCRHDSASGVDTTSLTDPAKVWRCDHCGLRWTQGEPEPTRMETR